MAHLWTTYLMRHGPLFPALYFHMRKPACSVCYLVQQVSYFVGVLWIEYVPKSTRLLTACQYPRHRQFTATSFFHRLNSRCSNRRHMDSTSSSSSFIHSFSQSVNHDNYLHLFFCVY